MGTAWPFRLLHVINEEEIPGQLGPVAEPAEILKRQNLLKPNGDGEKNMDSKAQIGWLFDVFLGWDWKHEFFLRGWFNMHLNGLLV